MIPTLLVGCVGQSSIPNPRFAGAGYLVYVRDREGSVLAGVDEQGKTLSVTADDGFGLRLSSGTPVPREFLDKELDEETGYEHFQARYYDPATAQWISPDPKLLADLDCSGRVQGCQPYAFAGNRPLEWTDEDGREILAFRAPDGTPTLIVTAAFVGPNAVGARDVFLQGVVNLKGAARVEAWTAVYKADAEVPEGLTKFEVDPGHVRSDGAHSSETEMGLGTIRLGKSALDENAPEEARSAEMIHELLHAAGHQSEGYFYADHVGGTCLSLPGHVNGYGGNYWRNPGATHLTEDEVHDLLNPEVPDLVNSAAKGSDPSFLANPTFRMGSGGANLPSLL